MPEGERPRGARVSTGASRFSMACRWLRRPLAPLPHLLAAYTRGVHSGALPPDVAALERIIMGRRACRKFDAARPIDVDVLAHILSLTQVRVFV